jgi:uncharacterized protein
MEVPRNALASDGVLSGDVILEIERNGQFFSGVAYSFMSGCNRESYEVTGSFSSDQQSIEMKGRRPVRTADCVIRSYQDDTLALSRAAAIANIPPAAPDPVPNTLPVNSSPSFDCNGRLAPDEATICADPALAALDRELDAAYKKVRAQLSAAQALRLRDEERAWVGLRHKCATDRDCLTVTYQSRIGQLKIWR